MKTINTAVNAKGQSFQQAFAKTKARSEEICDKIQWVFERVTIVTRRLFNFAVKLSVVLIALIMCHNFATANPEFTANVVNTVTTTCANTLDSIQNALNGLLCNMWPF